MELLNATKMVAGYTLGMTPEGRESLVVVAKGTYLIPAAGHPARLAPEQAPIVESDTFTGDPGFSATVHESEYAATKPRCDVLLNGSAYAPGGAPTTEVEVSLSVGSMKKSIKVIGKRTWRQTLLGPAPGPPEPFTAQPFSYDNAFGGSDTSHENPAKHAAYMANPVGSGFCLNSATEAIDGLPMPSTEEPGKPIGDPRGKYRPMAFGAVARHSEPRRLHAGTYDDAWLEDGFPFLPADFDPRYFQAAPDDQQIDYPSGGEPVELENLHPAGRVTFELPPTELPVEFFRSESTMEARQAVVDTLLIEPDLGTFCLTWRASLPLQKNVFEVPKCIVGKMPRGWYRARDLGKRYHGSLAELIEDS
ncbi:MAG: DUF2169 domain-containing protein [Planctomycetota bacterium]